MSLYIKNKDITITHSPCCPTLNVAEKILLYVIDVSLLKIHNGLLMMSQEKTP